MTKTYNAKPQEVSGSWQVLDASGRRLGQVATEAAWLLMGKHRPTYTPHVLTGDFVIVTNAAKVSVSGNKQVQKIYYRHSGYPGGMRATPLNVVLQRHPTRVIEHAVRGMLPKNSLGRQMFRRLKVYAGGEHPHQAQVSAELKTHRDPAKQEEGQ